MRTFWIIGAALTAVIVSKSQAEMRHVPKDYPTIQAAIDASSDGDEVVLADGTYTGDGNRDLDFGGRVITVRSAGGDPDLCVIDADGDLWNALHRSFVFQNGEPPEARVEGITMTGGVVYVGFGESDPPRGGAVLCTNGSPTFENCRFSGNRLNNDGFTSGASQPKGGAFYGGSCTSTFTDCVFSGNNAFAFGNVGAGAGIWGNGLTFIRCTILSNSSGGNCPGASGGGVQGSGTFIDCWFHGNSVSGGHSGGSSTSSGGAFYGFGTFINCLFTGNRASAGQSPLGGALYLTSTSLLLGCTFIDNRASGSSQFGGRGGAISMGSGRVLNCVFEDNWTTGNGGAIYCGGTARVTGCRFLRNDAIEVQAYYSTGIGGGIYSGDNANVQLTNCVLAENTAARGGALGTFFFGDVEMNNCTIADNVASDIGGGVFAKNVSVHNSVIQGNTPDQIGSTADVMYSIVEGGWTGAGNIDANASFVDPTRGDFRLAPGSPGIDAGFNDLLPPDHDDIDDDGNVREPIPLDIAGRIRVQDDPGTTDTGVPPAPIVDMGAHEFTPCPADVDGSGTVDTGDLVEVVLGWDCVNPPDLCPADVNGDGVVDVQDLVDIVLAWDSCG